MIKSIEDCCRVPAFACPLQQSFVGVIIVVEGYKGIKIIVVPTDKWTCGIWRGKEERL